MLKENNYLDELEIGAIEAAEIGEAASLLSRGMRDNPLHVAAFGEDPARRTQSLYRLFSGMLAVTGLPMLAARQTDGTIVSVLGMSCPGSRRPPAAQLLRLLIRLSSNGPRATLRTLRWVGAWARREPAGRHWRLGPVAVDEGLQRMGVGSRLMEVYCAQVDASGEDAYLETDKPDNVRFYERFGFELVGEQEVLGVPNWFMTRRPQGRRS
jgi:ribosomal protein S18 acetylase RimI-like enzyme